MPNSIKTILAPFDAAARYPGVSTGTKCWNDISSISSFPIPRENGIILPCQLSALVSECVHDNDIPLTLGGDHSLTFFTYKSVYDVLGPVDLVVFDAHHDSYTSNVLNHYTVFHHIKQLFDANIHWTGVRKDREDASHVRVFEDFSHIPSDARIYLSIDVDYFSPEIIPSVMDPVDDNGLHTLEVFSEALKSISAQIVAADIVEWQGALPSSTEYSDASIIFREVSETIIRSCID